MAAATKPRPAALEKPSDHAGFARDQAEFDALVKEQQQLAGEIRDMEASARNASGGSLDDRAKEFLQSGEVKSAATPAAQSQRLSLLRDRLQVVERAVELKRGDLDHAIYEASVEACRGAEPKVRALQLKQVEALVTFIQAGQAVVAVRDGLEQAGFRTMTLPVVLYPYGGQPGRLNDTSSFACMWLRELIEADVINGHEGFLAGTGFLESHRGLVK